MGKRFSVYCVAVAALAMLLGLAGAGLSSAYADHDRNGYRQGIFSRASAGGTPTAFLPRVVRVRSPHKPGTIIIDSKRKYLYLLHDDGTATRYGVGVGRPGFGWVGTHRVSRKAEWPDWRPPAEMRRRQPFLPVFLPGGPHNPMGARALYLGNTLYRIHGTTEDSTIGSAVSSGCIRMRNEDVMDLYEQVGVGTKVVVF